MLPLVTELDDECIIEYIFMLDTLSGRTKNWCFSMNSVGHCAVVNSRHQVDVDVVNMSSVEKCMTLPTIFNNFEICSS